MNPNREIKFRGKRIDNGKWIFGYYYSDNDGSFIIETLRNRFEVVPESVGQFTGLKDQSGKELYEGDILEWRLFFKSDFGKPDKIIKKRYEVVHEFNNIMGIVGFYFKDTIGRHIHFKNFSDIEIIGTVYENPELCSTH